MHLYSICMTYHVVCKNSNTAVGVFGAGSAFIIKGDMSSFWPSH
jgi:hypothetical protein